MIEGQTPNDDRDGNDPHWASHWSWPRLIEVLCRPDAPERIEITRILIAAIAQAFEQLRDETEREGGHATWDRSAILTSFSFPTLWDDPERTVEIQDPSQAWLWLLRIAIDLLTGGLRLMKGPDGDLEVRLPVAIERHLDSAPEARQRLTETWTGADLLQPQNRIPGQYRSHRAKVIVTTAKGVVSGDLCFAVNPRVVELDAEITQAVIQLGIVWDEGSRPARSLSLAVKQGFWQAIHDFFVELERRAFGEAFAQSIEVTVTEEAESTPSTIRIGMLDDRGQDFFESFVPLVMERPVKDHDFATSLKTPLDRVPEYALGSESPKLEILDENHQLFDHAFVIVQATMVAPGDLELRESLLATWQTDETLDDLLEARELPDASPVILTLATVRRLKALADGPSREERGRDLGDRALRGRIAGEILGVMLSCAYFHPEYVSVNNAVLVVRRRFKSEVSRGRINDNDSYLKSCWSEFRSVAHLWAAFEICFGDAEFGRSISNEELLQFLAVADFLRSLGERHFAPRQMAKHGPLLDPTATWSVPKKLALPTITLEPAPLTDDELVHLKRHAQ